MKIKVTEVEMTTLEEVQDDIQKQVEHDYKDRDLVIVRQLLLSGLAEETGEVLGINKKILRGFKKDEGYHRDDYLEELGDVLWYLTACCWAFGTTLDEIWELNKKKLNERGWRHE